MYSVAQMRETRPGSERVPSNRIATQRLLLVTNDFDRYFNPVFCSLKYERVILIYLVKHMGVYFPIQHTLMRVVFVL